MVSVNVNTAIAEFESRRDDMKALKTALDSLASDYNTSIASINNTIASITFDNWEDTVSVLLKSFVENMKAHVDTISKDVSSGSFLSLQKTAENLAKQLEACVNEKKRLEEQKENLAKTKTHVKSGNTTIKNPVYTMIENNITILENSLQAKVNICNQLFDLLATIEFNSKTPYQVPDVDVTEAVLQTNPNDSGTEIETEPGPGPANGTEPPTDSDTEPETEPPTTPNPEAEESVPWWKTALATSGHAVLSVVEGVFTGAERIADGAFSAIGFVAGLFGAKDFQSRLYDKIEEHWSHNLFSNIYDALHITEYTALPEDNFFVEIGCAADVVLLSWIGVPPTATAAVMGLGKGTQMSLERGSSDNMAFLNGTVMGVASGLLAYGVQVVADWISSSDIIVNAFENSAGGSAINGVVGDSAVDAVTDAAGKAATDAAADAAGKAVTAAAEETVKTVSESIRDSLLAGAGPMYEPVGDATVKAAADKAVEGTVKTVSEHMYDGLLKGAGALYDAVGNPIT